MFKKKIALLTVSAAMAVLAISPAWQPVYAQASAQGLKDAYANYFRIGTCFPSGQTSNTELKNVILREFNSLTHENELKPDQTMVQNGSTDEDIKVQLGNGARDVLKFCVDNNIPLRGHTLVWHSQTPSWFFYANMQSGNQQELATPATMYKRMNSYMKNLFDLIKKDYPTLNLYAYDVINEIFENSGKPRNAGFGGDNSPWVAVFGDNKFVDSAFTYARRHAPATCKLFYNDFNEYHPDGKRDTIAAMATRLKALGVIDGIGMQSHLSTSWPDMGTYKSALTKFVATGLEIHVTELDVTIEDGSTQAKQAEVYEAVFRALKEAREGGAKVTSVSVWGIRDDLSWRSGKSPLLFTQNYTKKPAYTAVDALIPQANRGDGKNPPLTPPPPTEVEPDANGYFFYHDFENGTTQGWGRRGDETVANSNAQKNSGQRSIYVSGRNNNWNGAMFALPSEFAAGKEYSFSAMARHEGQGTITFKLSIQYDDATGTRAYADVASKDAAAGAWVQISNTAYMLPAGGSNFSIYVELDNANASFYVDDAMGGVKGVTINPDGTPGTKPSTSVLPGPKQGHIRADKQLVTLIGKTLRVNGGIDSKVQIRIVDMRGKTVANYNAVGGMNISLRRIPAGVYAVEAKGASGGMASRLVLR